jgi:TatD DNase family protein
MLLVDAHAHLDREEFSDNLPSVITRAEKAGIKMVINAGVSLDTNKKSLDLSKKFKIVLPAFGLHPSECVSLTESDISSCLNFIKKNIKEPVAIGEIGLDHHWHKKPAEWKKQEDVFRRLLHIAEKYDKPVFVHTRSAVADSLRVLKDFPSLKVVIHSFEGKKSEIEVAISRGYFFSVPTSIVRNDHFQRLVKLAPISKLLTETDAPFLAPVKTDRNEPANISQSIVEIALIKGVTPEELSNQIFLNLTRDVLN